MSLTQYAPTPLESRLGRVAYRGSGPVDVSGVVLKVTVFFGSWWPLLGETATYTGKLTYFFFRKVVCCV
jgi:hypothetical protein